MKGNNKRKATDEGSANVPPKPKKRKSQGLNAMVPVGELQDSMLIDWLKNTPNATTRDCISHFTPYLTDEAKKSKFTALVKEVAQLRGGNLKLRDAYRGDGMASQQ
jgi:transcription initiation factor TFIIF subunit alpha